MYQSPLLDQFDRFADRSLLAPVLFLLALPARLQARLHAAVGLAVLLLGREFSEADHNYARLEEVGGQEAGFLCSYFGEGDEAVDFRVVDGNFIFCEGAILSKEGGKVDEGRVGRDCNINY